MKALPYSPLGLAFFPGPAKNAVAAAKGLCVFPSAPGLATLDLDSRYRAALMAADTRYVDSGFLALFWLLLSGQRLCRVSGLRFLQAFFREDRFRHERILWIHPAPPAQKRNQLYLEFEQKFPPALSSHYIAPMYPVDAPIEDTALLALIQQKSPHVIVINLGGGIQEPLGAYLKAKLPYTPIILCTGGAIDFLTGSQAPIPTWADRIFLGWLFRIATTPKSQAKTMRIHPAKRYWGAWRLLGMLWKWRERLPAGSQSS